MLNFSIRSFAFLMACGLGTSAAVADTHDAHVHLSTMFRGPDFPLSVQGNKLRLESADHGDAQQWRMKSTGNGWFKLQNRALGSEYCADVINDDEDDRLHMTECADYSGQYFKLVPTQYSGYYRVKTWFTGEHRCLDIVNAGKQNRPRFAHCAHYSGQFWRLEP